MTRYILNMTYQDFAEFVPEKIDTVLLPVGTIEAHGCTNLGTDVTIPDFICEHLAEKLDCLIAPTIPYGITRTLLPYPGSMTVNSESFEKYVGDVVISLFQTGLQNVIVINGHGGHYDELKRIAKRAWNETHGRTIIIHWWELCAPITQKLFGESGGHAGIDETAMVLAANPELVMPEQCKKVKPYLVRNGSYVYPNPAPILLYKNGEGAPKFDLSKANKYADKIIDFLYSFILDVMDGWKNNLRTR
ncbi:creatininase family protein [bacterium]|nr:creatininase family protein [bacterium]